MEIFKFGDRHQKLQVLALFHSFSLKMTPFIVLFFFLQVGKTENNALDSIVDQLDDVAVEGLLMLYLHALTFSGNMQARVYSNVY